MKSLVRHSAVLALIGFVLSPLEVVHALPTPADSVHFCQLIDFEQWRRDHPRPAGKRLAAMNKGEPRTVRMIYFLPSGLPYRASVVQKMKDKIIDVQTFFAEQLQAHGHGNRPFRIETDAQGEPLVHRVDGRHPLSHYLESITHNVVLDEIDPIFDIEANVYLIVIDSRGGSINYGDRLAGGVGSRWTKNGGFALVPSDPSETLGIFRPIAHELGHAFGLRHDFNDDTYIMSYGFIPDWMSTSWRLSACNAEFLAVHTYFNPNTPIREVSWPDIEEVTSSRVNTAGATSVPIRIKIHDSDGLHQVFLFTETKVICGATGFLELKECRRLENKTDEVVQFDYDGVIPSLKESDFNSFKAKRLRVMAVDALGNVSSKEFELFNNRIREPISKLFSSGNEGFINSIFFHPDGRLLAVESFPTTVKLWDVATGKSITTFPIPRRAGFGLRSAFSPDGKLFALLSSDGNIRLLDTSNGDQHDVIVSAHDIGEYGVSSISSLTFSPDGKVLASGGGEDCKIKLWDVASGEHIATLNSLKKSSTLRAPILSVIFSPDGKLIAAEFSDGTVNLWDVANRKRVAMVEAHESSGFRFGLSFSPDSKMLASGGSDGWSRSNNKREITITEVKLWDVSTGKSIDHIATLFGGAPMSFSPDSKMLVSASARETRWVDLDGLEGGTSQGSSDGGYGTRLWDVTTGEPIATLPPLGRTEAVAFSPDGSHLAEKLAYNTVNLWDVSEWTDSSKEESTAGEQAMPQSLTKVSGDGQEGQAGEQLAAPFVVSVLDQNGSAFAGAVVTFSVTAGGGTLSATTATTDANGRARSTLTLGSDPGTNTVEATVAGLESLTFTASGQATTDSDGDDEQADDEQAMPQSLTKVSGEGQAGQAGATLAEPFVVSVLDQNGSAYAGAVVTFSVTAGGGTLSATTTTTDANGRARSTLTLGSQPGTNTVAVTIAGLEPVAFTATATAIEQIPQSLTKVSGEGQAGQAGAALAAPFVVSVLDEDGAAIAGAPVAFLVTAGGGTLSSTTATTDANGRARSTLTLGSQPGTNTVTATVAELESVTFTASGYAIPHSLTKVSGDGQESAASTQLAAPFVVSVLDEDGAAIAGASVTFSVTAGGGTLSSTTATTDANGRARSTLTLGNQPGLNAVAATVAGLESVTFTASGYATPHSLTKVSGEGQEGPASTQLAEPFVVSVLDQDGAAIAGAVVTFSVTAGEGVLSSTTHANPCIVESSTSSTTATTDANGRAATRLTLGSEPGSNTVAAAVEGLGPVTFTATAAEQTTSHSLTKVCGDDQEGTASILLAAPFVVSVLDEDGAAMAGVVVTFSVTAGGGTLSSATATTEANGRAATRLTLGSEPGTNTVEATVEGLEPVTFTAIGQESPVVGLFDLFGSGKRVALPDSPQLAQNAPNPFNSQTVLSYFLHAPGPARLEVFALTGQRVAVLHQGPQQAGYHRLRWNGRDDTGRPVASGMYLYRLVTVEGVLTRKLILLR